MSDVEAGALRRAFGVLFEAICSQLVYVHGKWTVDCARFRFTGQKDVLERLVALYVEANLDGTHQEED